MKWRNHALMAGSLAVLMDLYPSEILYCMVAAHLPDQMEMIGKHRVIAHRTWTHDILLWFVPLLLTQVFSHLVPDALSLPTSDAGARFLTIRTWVLFLPGLFHLSGDMLTPGGIRLAGRKVGVGLFRTGHPMEYVVAGLFVLLAAMHRLGWRHFILGT